LRAAAVQLAVSRLSPYCRALLAAEKPAIAVICPCSVTERVPMIGAAAAAGCHIYCEKPLAERAHPLQG
jgi:predicted dehydrogenase